METREKRVRTGAVSETMSPPFETSDRSAKASAWGAAAKTARARVVDVVRERGSQSRAQLRRRT